jgi:hypothetical protein
MSALLLHGGQITAQRTKDGGAFDGAKAAGNLLAQFHHAQIGFSLIVGQRHLKVGHETQDEVLMLLQAEEKIEDIAFLDGSALAFAFRWRGIGGQAEVYQLPIAARDASC